MPCRLDRSTLPSGKEMDLQSSSTIAAGKGGHLIAAPGTADMAPGAESIVKDCAAVATLVLQLVRRGAWFAFCLGLPVIADGMSSCRP